MSYPVIKTRYDIKRVEKWIFEEFPEAVQDGKEILLDCINPKCTNAHHHCSINVKKGVGRCFVCEWGNSKGGFSLVQFVAKHKGCSFFEAREFLRGNESVSLSSIKKMLELEEEAEEEEIRENHFALPNGYRKVWFGKSYGFGCPKYIKDRNYKISTLAKFGVGWVHDGFFPYVDSEGEVRKFPIRNRMVIPINSSGQTSWVARVLGTPGVYEFYGKEYKEQKYLNPPGSYHANLLFNYDDVVFSDEIIIVEGVTDVMRLWEFGFKAVATFGSKISWKQLSMLLNTTAKKLIFLFDNDAFSKAENYANIMNPFIDSVAVLLPIGKDPDTMDKISISRLINRGSNFSDLVKLRLGV